MAVSATPLHAQVAEGVRRSIATKELPPGAELPSESQLCEQYGVSRITVRKALSTLEQEGLIVSAQGRPRRVRQFMPIDHHPMTNERLNQRERDRDSYVAEVVKTGREPTTSFAMRIEDADQEVATLLKIETDGLVCIRDVTRYVDDEPWSVQTSYYPMDIAQASGLATPQNIPQGTVRAMADAGFVEAGYVDTVTARMASPDEARRLDVGAGTPLLVHLRTAGLLTPSLILRAALSGGLRFCEAAFAELGGVALDRVAALLRQAGPARDALYACAGLPNSLQPALLAVVSALYERPAEEPGLCPRLIARAFAACATPGDESVRRLLARYDAEAMKQEARLAPSETEQRHGRALAERDRPAASGAAGAPSTRVRPTPDWTTRESALEQAA